MRVEVSFRFMERPDGTIQQDIQGIAYEGSGNGMETMNELNVHEAMAYALDFIQNFHKQTAERQKQAQVPKVQLARAPIQA